jgi:hypothetical protein
MKNISYITAEDLKKFPRYQQVNDINNDSPQHTNTGDWGDLDEDEEARTDPEHNEESGINNSDGAGSSGSAVTNS